MPKPKRSTSKAMEGWAATRGRRGVIAQAADDLRRGQKDTDCRTARPKKKAMPPR